MGMSRREVLSAGAVAAGSLVTAPLFGNTAAAADTPSEAEDAASDDNGDRVRARELGVAPGQWPTGPDNGITDVEGVRVGQVTLFDGDDVRTGVTAVLPHAGNLFQDKVAGAVHVANGFGKLAGSTQVVELGNIETPVILTNTLSVAAGLDGAVQWSLAQPDNDTVASVNAVVGETNDSALNDIRGQHVTADHVIEAIEQASADPIAEGSVGAGTGTTCFGWKGGIGTSSRAVDDYTLGVLVQSNYGGALTIDGVPFWDELEPDAADAVADEADQGSIIIVVATDAPLSPRNLDRLGARSLFAMSRTGAGYTNGSGDYAVAFSTAEEVRTEHGSSDIRTMQELPNDGMSDLFAAVQEATEEAIYNSMFMATTVTGHGGTTRQAIPLGQVRRILRRYGRGRG